MEDEEANTIEVSLSEGETRDISEEAYREYRYRRWNGEMAVIIVNNPLTVTKVPGLFQEVLDRNGVLWVRLPEPGLDGCIVKRVYSQHKADIQ
jgi:hypothetical protein